MASACLPGLLVALMTAVAAATAAPPSAAKTDRVQLAVVAPAVGDHLAWAGAAQLQRFARDQGVDVDVEQASATTSDRPLPGLLIMPVRSLATQVGALQILELPFFYPPSVRAMHDRLDGELGRSLADEARKSGWEILAYWDEGMHALSGLTRYDRARNVRGREFLITRPDPVAEKQFWYWKAHARRIRPENREHTLRECLIASRAATLQELVQEQLYRVHLDISLTNHRYEGWVVVAPAERWAQLAMATREKLAVALRAATAWQRDDARRREAAALAELRQRGMVIHEVDAEEREAFRKALPDWAELLSDELDLEQKRRLVTLASTGAASVAGPGGPAAAETGGDPAPGAPAR